MSANVFSLPVPLILLVHLHILQYPHANKPEYDHSIFDACVRGLRDRTRTMEDVSYFLVARIEGKDLVRKVLPTYPCAQPADTSAFRTGLAKILEKLRHQPGSKSLAWWWRDVVVRKSLLEECAGERFERLLLALSTHALAKGSACNVELNETHALLRGQPHIYTTRLTAFQSSRNSWARSASLLIQQQRDLRATVQGSGGSTKYNSLSTEKLRALAHSKLHDLLAVHWAGPAGRSALTFFAELAGLKQLDSRAPSQPAHAPDAAAVATPPPPPLPVAAAHHPATLRKLRMRIFPKESATAPTPNSVSVPHAEVALSESTNAHARTLQTLTAAVARTRKATTNLKARLAKRKPMSTPLRAVNLNLWQDSAHPIHIDFESTSFSFAALGLPAPGSEAPIDARVEAIRLGLIPRYPPVPIGLSQPTPATSRLPQPARRRSPPQTPKAERRPETSTPPGTVRPTHSEAERVGAATPTPRARPTHSFMIRPLDAAFQYNVNDTDEDEFGEGASMSVRDLLLQADTTHFDIIGYGEAGDESGGFVDESFGWA